MIELMRKGIGLCAFAAALDVATAAAITAEETKPPAQLNLEWSLAKTDKPLEREATITVTDQQGESVQDAVIEVTVDMPSMPMMHRVPMVRAEPTDEPGIYRARFGLEMPGEWAAQIEIKQPQRTKFLKNFYVD